MLMLPPMLLLMMMHIIIWVSLPVCILWSIVISIVEAASERTTKEEDMRCFVLFVLFRQETGNNDMDVPVRWKRKIVSTARGCVCVIKIQFMHSIQGTDGTEEVKTPEEGAMEQSNRVEIDRITILHE